MNPLLTQAEEQIYAALNPPQLKTAVDKVVAAGKKVMYSEESRDLLLEQLQELNGPDNADEVIGAGIAKLIGILFNQSKNTIPMEVLTPAATLLLLDALDLVENTGKLEVTPDSLAECMQSMASNFLQLFGVTPDKLQEYMGAAEAQQPASPAPGIVNAAMGAQS